MAWLGIEGVGYTAALRAEGLVRGWGPGREALDTMSARPFCRLGTDGAPGGKGHVIQVCCAILVPENRAWHTEVFNTHWMDEWISE